MSRPKSTPKSAPKSAPQNPTQGTHETVFQSAAQGTPETAPQNAARTTPQGMPAAAPQSASQHTAQSAPQGATQSVSQGATQSASQGAAPAPAPMLEVRIDKMLDGGTKTKAFASANLFGQFAIHGLRVVETERGRFIAMPQDSYEKNGEKKYTDTFHPITAGARTMLVEAVNNAYEQKLAEQMAQLKNAAMQVQAGMGGMQA